MAVSAKVGTPAGFVFPLYQADGFTPLTGEAANVEAYVTRSTTAGGAVLTALAVEITEMSDQPGQYVATFTPDVDGRTYVVVVRHAGSSADIEEVFQTSSDLTNILLLLGGGVSGLPA
jgi:hypothetical protein